MATAETTTTAIPATTISTKMIDPSIVLAASQKPISLQGPLDTFQKYLSLRDMVNTAHMNQLQAQQQQQAFQDQQSLRTLLQSNANPTAEQIYGAAGPTLGTSVIKGMTEAKQAAANLQKK